MKSLRLFRVNLSHPVCGCLLMFGWSWQGFCIHNTFFRQPAGEPQRTSFARLGWDQKWSWMSGLPCGCTCATHRQTNTHRQKKTTTIELCFAVNKAGCTRKSVDDLPDVEAATKRGTWIMHHFRTTEKIILRLRTYDSVEVGDIWRRLLKHQGSEQSIKIILE